MSECIVIANTENLDELSTSFDLAIFHELFLQLGLQLTCAR